MNSMMQDLLPNVPLKNSEKHLTNHSARKTVAIKIKQQQVRKSERTTGQNRKAGVDAYDSGEKVQEKQPPYFIGSHHPTTSKHKYSISPNDPNNLESSFSFFSNDNQFYKNLSVTNPFSFDYCKVHFHKNN